MSDEKAFCLSSGKTSNLRISKFQDKWTNFQDILLIWGRLVKFLEFWDSGLSHERTALAENKKYKSYRFSSKSIKHNPHITAQWIPLFCRLHRSVLYKSRYTSKGEKIKRGDIALNGKPISALQSFTCCMGSHSVTCHTPQVNAPRLNPGQIGWYSIYLPRRDGRLRMTWTAGYIPRRLTCRR